MSAKHGELTDKLVCGKLQNAARATVSDNLKLVAGNWERPNKREKVTRWCREPSTTPSVAASFLLPASRKNLENRCEALPLENQCILGSATEAMELLEDSASRKKVDAAIKTAPKGRGEQGAAAADRFAPTLETALASAKASHSCLIDVATRSEADTNKARMA